MTTATLKREFILAYYSSILESLTVDERHDDKYQAWSQEQEAEKSQFEL